MITKLTKSSNGEIQMHTIGAGAQERSPLRFKAHEDNKAKINARIRADLEAKREQRRKYEMAKSQRPSTTSKASFLTKFHLYTPRRSRSQYYISINNYSIRPNVKVYKHFNGYKWFDIGFDDTSMILLKVSKNAPHALLIQSKNHCYKGFASANLINHIKEHIPMAHRTELSIGTQKYAAKVVKPNYIVFDLSHSI